MSFTDTRAPAKDFGVNWQMHIARDGAGRVSSQASRECGGRPRKIPTRDAAWGVALNQVTLSSYPVTAYIAVAELGAWANISRHSNSMRHLQPLGDGKQPLR